MSLPGRASPAINNRHRLHSILKHYPGEARASRRYGSQTLAAGAGAAASPTRRALIRTQDVVKSIDANARVAGDADMAILYVTGVGMRTHTGVARTMFGALAQRGINIIMINTSEVCVSVVVELDRGEEARKKNLTTKHTKCTK